MKAMMERNIRVKKDICSMWRMRVSDNEGYDNRCDQSTSQDLGDNSTIKVSDNQSINDEQGIETKHETFAKA
jgi:hypothetical protein